jgi:hypothetical protein
MPAVDQCEWSDVNGSVLIGAMAMGTKSMGALRLTYKREEREKMLYLTGKNLLSEKVVGDLRGLNTTILNMTN